MSRISVIVCYIKPTFYKLEKEYEDISFNAIDVDMNGDLAEKYEVESMPTFIFINKDKEVDRFCGADANKLKASTEMLNNL